MVFGAAVFPENLLFLSEPTCLPAEEDGTESLDKLPVWSSSPPYPTMRFLITGLYYTEKGVEKQGTNGYKGP